MSFLRNIFGKGERPIKSYADFWNWFKDNEQTFFKVVKAHKNIEEQFFDVISPKLDRIKDGIFFLTGMIDDQTAELVLTPDGNVRNIVFVEELIAAATDIPGWKFTALKPALGIENVNIEMAGNKFNKENLFFYSNDYSKYPDEIDISVVHNEFTEANKSNLINGTYIFLDNFLGELNFITKIDSMNVIGKEDAKKDLVPIEKLKDFINWRQKEFVEKYEGTRYEIENDTHSIMEAELESGNMLIAVINTDLLRWDNKASHPWIASIEIDYKGNSNNGMPDESMMEQLEKIEEEVLNQLKDYEGHLYIGRQTADSVREIYFACKDFRKPSKVIYEISKKYEGALEVTYDIYKDKYWRSFDRFDVV